MLKRLRDRHPMAYCVFSEGLFFVIMLLKARCWRSALWRLVWM